MSKCKFCNAEISWMKEGRKNVPVEHDGATHKCEEMIKSRESFKKLGPKSISPEEIKKYEDAMNQKNKT